MATVELWEAGRLQYRDFQSGSSSIGELYLRGDGWLIIEWRGGAIDLIPPNRVLRASPLPGEYLTLDEQRQRDADLAASRS